jgi:hypothetical protein
MHSLHDPESGSLNSLSTADMDQLLTIRNPEMQLAPFLEPDFLRLPQAVTLYKPYLGSLPPDFDYHPCTLIPEVMEEPGVIPGDDWHCNVEGLAPQHSYTIPGLGGRMVEAPFYRYDFLPNYPELLLSRGCNYPSHLCPLRAREDPYPHQVLTSKEAYTFFPRETFTPMVDFAIQQERDKTLCAEVQHFRSAHDRVGNLAKDLANL